MCFECNSWSFCFQDSLILCNLYMIHSRCVRCIQIRSKDSQVKTQLICTSCALTCVWIFTPYLYYAVFLNFEIVCQFWTISGHESTSYCETQCVFILLYVCMSLAFLHVIWIPIFLLNGLWLPHLVVYILATLTTFGAEYSLCISSLNEFSTLNISHILCSVYLNIWLLYKVSASV
jgi:hypothetical protein